MGLGSKVRKHTPCLTNGGPAQVIFQQEVSPELCAHVLQTCRSPAGGDCKVHSISGPSADKLIHPQPHFRKIQSIVTSITGVWQTPGHGKWCHGQPSLSLRVVGREDAYMQTLSRASKTTETAFRAASPATCLSIRNTTHLPWALNP